jgi:hypothetical protein
MLILGVPEMLKTYQDTDRVMLSVIQNCIQNHDQFLKDLKSLKKRVKKSFILNKGQVTFPRSLGFLKKYYDYLLKEKVDSSYWYYRLAMMTQTRATGLPTGGMRQASLEKFKTVTSTASERLWDKLTLQESTKKLLLKKIPQEFNSVGMLAPRVSISTSACFQTLKEHGGKAQFTKDLLLEEEYGYIEEVNLDTGDLTGNYISTDTLGDWIFHYSLGKYKDGYNMLRTKFATVREPSKIRSVTSADYFHCQILQPYSHLTLKALSMIPEFKIGVKGSRDGWSVYTCIDYDLNFDAKQKPYAQSIDLETATDYFNQLLVSDFLEVWNEVLNIPKWYGRVVIFLLTSPRLIYLGKDYWFTTSRGCLMGDPVTKTVLTSLYINLFNLVKFFRAKGDDLVALDPLKVNLKKCKIYLKSLDIKLSPEDTFITRDCFVYTEELCRVPRTRNECWSHIQRSKRWGRHMYCDYPRIRLILDTVKDREGFSSTPQGKIDLLGRDWEYCRSSGPWYFFALASLLQDICLRLYERKTLVYIPTALAGSGKVFPFQFSNVLDFESRRGMGDLVLSTLNYLQDTLEKDVPSEPLFGLANVFSRHVDGAAFKAVVPSKMLEPFKSKILDFGFDLGQIAIGRVKKYICSENELLGKLLSLKREDWLLGLEEPPEEITLDMDALSILSTNVRLPRSSTIRMWLLEPYQLKSRISIKYYDREAIEELAFSSKLKVTLPFCLEGSTYVGGIDPEFERESKILFEWFKDFWSGIERPIPQSIIDDDEVIFLSVLKTNKKNIYIVTDDRRLLRRCASVLPWRKNLYRIPVKAWVGMECSENNFPIFDDSVIYIDQAQVSRLLETNPMMMFGQPGWFIKDLHFSSTFNVDMEYVEVSYTPEVYKVSVV